MRPFVPTVRTPVTIQSAMVSLLRTGGEVSNSCCPAQFSYPSRASRCLEVSSDVLLGWLVGPSDEDRVLLGEWLDCGAPR